MPATTTTTRTKIPINDESSTQLSFNHPSHTHARQWLQQRIIMNMLNPFMTTTLNYCKHKFIQDQVVVTVVQFPHFSPISIPSPPTTNNLNLWFRRVSFTRLTGWLNARLLRLLFIQFLPSSSTALPTKKNYWRWTCCVCWSLFTLVWFRFRWRGWRMAIKFLNT